MGKLLKDLDVTEGDWVICTSDGGFPHDFKKGKLYPVVTPGHTQEVISEQGDGFQPRHSLFEKVPPTSLSKSLLAERETTHGDFRDNSLISQQLKEVVRDSVNWENLTEYQKESLDLILHKVSRIVSGDPDHQDHWDDIAGYAKLVSGILYD